MQKTKAKSKLNIKTGKSRSARKSIATRGPVKHVKHVLSITPKFVHGMVVGAFVGLLVVSFLRHVSPVNALSLNVSRDCTANAVIKCGALTTDELKARYSQAGVAAIYGFYGISADDIKNIGSTAVAGTAYKDGTIKLNSTGKIVATGAKSTGRQPISGSVKVNYGGVTFYETTNQKAFRANALAVYVVMTNGEFDFAIVPNCGNPMKAVAVVQPKSIPTPQPPPTANITPTPPEETPPPTALAPIPVSTAPQVLPSTGPREVLIVAILAVIGGYLFHATHRHIRARRHRHRTLGHH